MLKSAYGANETNSFIIFEQILERDGRLRRPSSTPEEICGILETISLVS